MVVLDIGVALEWLDPVHKLVSPADEKGKKGSLIIVRKPQCMIHLLIRIRLKFVTDVVNYVDMGHC